MNVLDLFSGIGGFSLGLERCGMRTVAFCESNAFCRRVLKRHWADVPCFDEVRELHGRSDAYIGNGPILVGLAAPIDLICGGFPCQDISMAGTGAGLAGTRSSLWIEFARLVREIRPAYVLVENVAALLGRGLGDILRDLAQIGYDAEWHCIPAAHVGAPHRRDRIWVVAYPYSGGREVLRLSQYIDLVCDARALADRRRAPRRRDGTAHDDPHTDRIDARCQLHAAADGVRTAQSASQGTGSRVRASGHWATEPHVGRVAHGIPHRVDRLRALGNAAVPQVVEMLGHAIQAHALAQRAEIGIDPLLCYSP